MPAKKPASLVVKHDVKAARKKRAAGEAALQPRVNLQLKAPGRLKGYRGAGTLWRRMIEMYRGLDAAIVSRLDQDMLVSYCILDVQEAEMDKLRAAAFKNYTKAQATLDRRAAKEEIDPKVLIKWQDSVNWALGTIVKLDARVDRKRALLHVLRQSLYLTPRSRAGVTPPEKAPEKPKGDMEKLLDGE
jgi:hypothetical protein